MSSDKCNAYSDCSVAVVEQNVHDIQLDKQPPVYNTGETITGTIVVTSAGLVPRHTSKSGFNFILLN